MALSFRAFGIFLLVGAVVISMESRAESFDFFNSFLVQKAGCSGDESNLTLTEGDKRSAFVVVGDFGADVEIEHAKRTCVRVSGDSEAQVIHKQLLGCKTKRNFIFQCSNYVLCRSQNYAPKRSGSCRSISAGVDATALELTRALYGSGNENWSIANLLFSAIYFRKDLIPENNEDALLEWLSSVDLSEPASARRLLIALGFVLQRPKSLDDVEIQRFVSYANNLNVGGLQPYIEPREIRRLSNTALQRITIELYMNALPDSWGIAQ